MTKKEFILNAMLQMAANPKYVEIKKENDDKGQPVTFPAIDDEIIFIDAEALANEAEKRMDKPFDDDDFEDRMPLKTAIQNIAEKLGDIEEEMEREFDIEHDIK